MGAIVIIGIIIVFIFLFGIRIIRPTKRGLVERLGKYKRFANPGFNWVIPFIDKMYKVNVTEQMVDAEPQEIITTDIMKLIIADNQTDRKRSQCIQCLTQIHCLVNIVSGMTQIGIDSL